MYSTSAPLTPPPLLQPTSRVPPPRYTTRPAPEHDINSLPSHFATNQQKQDRDILSNEAEANPPAGSPFLLWYPLSPPPPPKPNKAKQSKANQSKHPKRSPCVCVCTTYRDRRQSSNHHQHPLPQPPQSANATRAQCNAMPKTKEKCKCTEPTPIYE